MHHNVGRDFFVDCRVDFRSYVALGTATRRISLTYKFLLYTAHSGPTGVLIVSSKKSIGETCMSAKRLGTYVLRTTSPRTVIIM